MLKKDSRCINYHIYMMPVALLLVICMLAVLFPAGAQAETPVSRVACQTYPGIMTGGNDLPFAGQDYSAFYCTTSNDYLMVAGWSLVDGNGNACYGRIENRTYTLYITVVLSDSDHVFTSATDALINNVPAGISVAADGRSATLSRVIDPPLLAPTIYHSPTDEVHNSGELFSYSAVATRIYSGFQWYLRTPDGRDIKAEDIYQYFPQTEANIYDNGNGIVCNFRNVPQEMDGWQVYCSFISDAGVTNTGKAGIVIANKTEPTPEPTPTPTPTPAPTPSPTPMPTPSPVITPEPVEDEGILTVVEDWDTKWSFDEDYHWHKSLVPGNTDISDKGTHDMVWSEILAPSRRSDGEEQGTCSQCGFSTFRAVEYSGTNKLNTMAIAGAALGIAGAVITLAAAIVAVSNIANSIKRRNRARRINKYRR